MRLFILTLIIASTTGCCTKKLWAPPDHIVVPHKEEPRWTYRKVKPKAATIQYKQDTENFGFVAVENTVEAEEIPMWKKICWTPVTLSLDILTLPIQSLLVDPFGIKQDRLDKRNEYWEKKAEFYNKPRL